MYMGLSKNEVLKAARQELARAIYTFETSDNKGLSKIAANKCDWLAPLISMAESYCNFHWVDCFLITPEFSSKGSSDKAISCLVVVRHKNRFSIKKCKRVRKLFGGWKWRGVNEAYVTHWAYLPTLPEVLQ